jgi:DNA-binding NarL/FixJ family response regulator
VETSRVTRVWIDDGNAIFRRGLVSSLVGEPFAVVGESAGLVPQPVLADADILVFGLEGTRLERVAELSAGTGAKLVALTGSASEDDLASAVEAGVSGLLIRADLTPSALLSCLTAVVEGHGSVPPALLARLTRRLAGAELACVPRDGELVKRELQVLRILAEGGDTREVAARLSYSERTVKNIVHDVLLKLNCRTRAHAVAAATRQGFI